MKRLFGVIVLLTVLFGCANQLGLTVKIDTVGGDFWTRKVGSSNQQVDTGQSTFTGSTTGINGVPPVGLDWTSTMQAKVSRIEIKNVSGSVYFESAGSDNQGINIPDILEKIYLPGDPFLIKEN